MLLPLDESELGWKEDPIVYPDLILVRILTEERRRGSGVHQHLSNHPDALSPAQPDERLVGRSVDSVRRRGHDRRRNAA
jgi:hypothetical protein